jgi:ribosome-associated toxin RatA of RatAB toxin-antitoxin module
MEAALEAGFAGISESYTSRVTCVEPAIIIVRYILLLHCLLLQRDESDHSFTFSVALTLLPNVLSSFRFYFFQAQSSCSTIFENLLTIWTFSEGPTKQTTHVHFYISFLFRNSFHSTVTRAVFDRINNETISAFEKRAGVMADRA